MDTCGFTGYRPEKLPFYGEDHPRCNRLREALAQSIALAYGEGCRHFICGFALGADTLFAEEVLLFRDGHPDVALEAAVPWPGQADVWSQGDRERYRLLLRACDTVSYVSDGYHAGCYAKRNQYILKNSQVLIAVFSPGDQRRGGTRSTVEKARAAGLPVWVIEP